jgi:hypothetical protein
MTLSRPLRLLLNFCLAAGLTAAAVVPLQAQTELSYSQYRTLSWAAGRLDHLVQFEPIHGETGMFFALGERFGTVQVIKLDGSGARQVWKSNQLNGVPEEMLAADMNGDGLDDTILCRTSNGIMYAWSMDGYTQVWESLTGEYQQITCFTIANMDEDPANEIVMVADDRIVYVDGANFSKQFTSINEYQATQVRCGDVDGDNRMEIVLNTGQVLDSGTAAVEWEDETFFSRIELLDIDGDGIPEVLTENPGGGPLKVFDVDYRSEVRFQ